MAAQASVTHASSQPAGDAPAALVEMRAITKRFGGVRALRGVNLTLARRGVVHGLVGENGSGKSTLLGILSGQLRPDEGTVLLDGDPIVLRSPRTALQQGVAMVSQETAVAPHLTVAENILLGRGLVRTRWGIDWSKTRELSTKYLEMLGLDYDPTWQVGSLRGDQRQMVEIARALSSGARLLILDEPTSSLTDDEIAGLFAAVRNLKRHGVSIIYVSHRMSEIFELTDEVTVLRDGLDVDAGPTAAYDPHSLVEAMVGRAGAWRADSASSEPSPEADQTPVLSIRGLCVEGVLDQVDLDVGPGEIVGLAGLVGAGRSELLETIFGERPISAGQVELDAQPHHPQGARESIVDGIGFLPPDRKTQGLVLLRSVTENLMMVATSRRGRLTDPRRRGELKATKELIKTLGIRGAPDVAVGTLSGGNQQKVAIGRCMVAAPKVLLLDEPTRGVDVAAKAEIHSLLRETAARGTALVVSSSETPELLELCHRVVVMFRGRVVASLTGPNATEAAVARYAGGNT
jgi:ABC-type sugar transport system ATPase subunit